MPSQKVDENRAYSYVQESVRGRNASSSKQREADDLDCVGQDGDEPGFALLRRTGLAQVKLEEIKIQKIRQEIDSGKSNLGIVKMPCVPALRIHNRGKSRAGILAIDRNLGDQNFGD
jgi:hypothetical protein